MAMVHVPAWKRLGLKLKYADDVPEKDVSVLPTLESTNVPKKRKLSAESPDKAPTDRLYANSVDPGQGNHDQKEWSGKVTEEAQTLSAEEIKSDATRKRKSVSFSEDTKITDGGKNLLNRRKQDPSRRKKTGDANANGTLASPGSDEGSQISKKKPKVKKTSRESLENTTSTIKVPDEFYTPAHLQYLEEYQFARSTWKFNKARQNYVIKHAFDLDQISTDYDTALHLYTVGLEGTSARLWLRDRAQRVIDEDEADLAKRLEEDSATPPSESLSNDLEQKEEQPSTVDPSSSKEKTFANHIAQYRTMVLQLTEKVGSGISPTGEDEAGSGRLELDELMKRFYRRRRAETLLAVIMRNPPAPDKPSTNGSEGQASKPNVEEEIKDLPKPSETTTEPAVIVLKASTTHVAETPSTTVTAPKANAAGSGQKRKRKRPGKRRDVFDKSSSESSSSSSSSEDEDTVQRKKKPLTSSIVVREKGDIKLREKSGIKLIRKEGGKSFKNSDSE